MENESLESSLTDLGLIPTSILNFAWHPDMAEEVKQQLGPNAAYLKDSIMALAKSDWNILASKTWFQFKVKYF